MAETTKLNSLKINLLTNEQYKTAKEAGEIDLNQLYMITDEVNEPVSWNDLTDKPFGEMTEYTKVKEHTINCNEFKKNGYYGSESVSGDDYLAYSKNVSFDSVMYYNINRVDSYTCAYGNEYLYDSSKEDNGLPFFFKVIVDDDIYPVSIDIYAKTQGEHTIALYRESSTVQTIEEKFIPDTIARTSDIDAAIAGLVDTAPDTLNTLNELAAALGDDPNFATTVLEQVGNKVEKVDGMGLSSNDYTDAEQAKLGTVEEGATATSIVIKSWTAADMV